MEKGEEDGKEGDDGKGKDGDGRDRRGRDRNRRSGIGGYSPRKREGELGNRTPSPIRRRSRSPDKKKKKGWDEAPPGIDPALAAAMAQQLAAQQAVQQSQFGVGSLSAGGTGVGQQSSTLLATQQALLAQHLAAGQKAGGMFAPGGVAGVTGSAPAIQAAIASAPPELQQQLAEAQKKAAAAVAAAGMGDAAAASAGLLSGGMGMGVGGVGVAGLGAMGLGGLDASLLAQMNSPAVSQVRGCGTIATWS